MPDFGQAYTQSELESIVRNNALRALRQSPQYQNAMQYADELLDDGQDYLQNTYDNVRGKNNSGSNKSGSSSKTGNNSQVKVRPSFDIESYGVSFSGANYRCTGTVDAKISFNGVTPSLSLTGGSISTTYYTAVGNLNSGGSYNISNNSYSVYTNFGGSSGNNSYSIGVSYNSGNNSWALNASYAYSDSLRTSLNVGNSDENNVVSVTFVLKID